MPQVIKPVKKPVGKPGIGSAIGSIIGAIGKKPVAGKTPIKGPVKAIGMGAKAFKQAKKTAKK